MKFLIVFVAALAIAAAQEEKADSTTPVAEALETSTVALKLEGPTDSPTHMTRDLPADVLRDFPGLCFASTLCRVFEVGTTWQLKPFCGNSTCLVSPDGILVERVTDCGILPKPNQRCQVINEADRENVFPACCPIFQCEKDVTLEYPTQEELHASFVNSQLPESADPIVAPSKIE